jgi:hypothetical protein
MVLSETGRSAMIGMSSELDAVVKALQHELALPQIDRSSYASTQSLESAIDRCVSVIGAIRVGKTNRAVEIFDTVSRTALDEWELTSELATVVASCAQNLRGRYRKR